MLLVNPDHSLMRQISLPPTPYRWRSGPADTVYCGLPAPSRPVKCLVHLACLMKALGRSEWKNDWSQTPHVWVRWDLITSSLGVTSTCPKRQKGPLKLDYSGYSVLFSKNLLPLDKISLNLHRGQTSGKLVKIITKLDQFCHPAYLTYMQSTSWETLGWRKHKLESKLPGEISIISDMQMTSPLWQKVKRS